MRMCTKCNEQFEDSAFYLKSKKHKERRSWCKWCCDLYRKLEYKNTPGNAEKIKSRVRKNAKNRRIEALNIYGGKCACCGETTYEFLTFDHKDGRKVLNHSRELQSQKLLKWIRDNNYPDSIQVLCYNCNCAKGRHDVGGICPHKRTYINKSQDLARNEQELFYRNLYL